MSYTYHLSITCPRCAGQLDSVTESRPSLNSTSAIAVCTNCRREITIYVQVCLKERTAIIHGTPRGYHHHVQEGTDPCVECRAAKAQQMMDYKIKRRAKVKA